MTLYALLLAGSIAIPLILSFDKKLQFYKSWKYVLPSTFLVAVVYIAFDVYLTKAGVWGFNPVYHSKTKILGLPIEEWLFFLVIPYASLFLHYALVLYFPKFQLKKQQTQLITKTLIVFFLFIALLNMGKLYTVYILLTTILLLVLSLLDKSNFMQSYYPTFLVILVPFILINSILTGSFIESEVVWYNDMENLNLRFLSIPVEDFTYAFSMLGFNILIVENLRKKY